MERKVKLHHQTHLKQIKDEGLKKIFPGKPRIAVGYASRGIAAGADKVMRALEEEIKRRKLDVVLTKVGCIGYCTREPLVNVSIPDMPMIIYSDVVPDDAKAILDSLVKNDVCREKALCRIERWDHITKGMSLNTAKVLPISRPMPMCRFSQYRKKSS